MEITLTRQHKGPASTIGELAIAGSPFTCLTLEDVDRGLTQSMSLAQIAAKKVQNQTAIPAGRYQVIIDHSDHFGKEMPHVLNVPGYAGIRIHCGNTDADTDGCILLGTDEVNPDFIEKSRVAFEAFWLLLKQAIEIGKETIFITIQ